MPSMKTEEKEEGREVELRGNHMYRELMKDTIQMLSHQIVESGGQENAEKTLERYNLMNHIFNNVFLNKEERKEGEIAIRKRMANVYMVCCVVNPYGSLDTGVEELSGLMPLYQLDKKGWDSVKSILRKLSLMMMGPEDKDLPLYTTKLEKVNQLICIQQAVCGFRETLEEQFRTKQDETARVDTAILKEFVDFVEGQKDGMIKMALENLFVHRAGTPGRTRSSGVSLQNLGRLRDQFSVKPFNLTTLQSKIRFLLVGWMNDYFKTPPTLVQLGYSELLGLPKDQVEEEARIGAKNEPEEDAEEDEEQFLATQPPVEGIMMTGEDEEISDEEEDDRKPAAKNVTADNAAELQNLQTARDNLRRDVQDPLEECNEIAAGALKAKKSPGSGSKKMGLYRKRKTAIKIAFSPDGDEESQGDGEQPNLNAVARSTRMRSPTPKRGRSTTVRNNEYEPDHPLLNPNGTRKRRKFTEQEKVAIREGVRKFGFGKWSKIRAEYGEILRQRTNVNIKDCYRTMMSKDEV